MKKNELRERIKSLPLFEKRTVWVQDEEGGKKQQKHSAICSENDAVSYAYVGPGYNLVQFHEIFTPILDSIPEEVKGYLVSYGGFAAMKIFPEIEELKEGKDRFGLLARNSCDMSSAIVVSFVVERDGHQFTIPPDVAGLKKQHTTGAENVVKDYVSMVGKVKELWARIVNEFPKYQIVREIKPELGDGQYLELGDVAQRLKLGKRMTKKVVEEFDRVTADGREYNLWQFFIFVLERINEKKCKSDVHKDKKIDKMCKEIFKYAITMGI